LQEISKTLKGKTNVPELERLTSEFYSNIPHDFGFQRAPTIKTDKDVKLKLDMLESIEQI